jgi:hypothetical protein
VRGGHPVRIGPVNLLCMSRAWERLVAALLRGGCTVFAVDSQPGRSGRAEL